MILKWFMKVALAVRLFFSKLSCFEIRPFYFNITENGLLSFSWILCVAHFRNCPIAIWNRSFLFETSKQKIKVQMCIPVRFYFISVLFLFFYICNFSFTNYTFTSCWRPCHWPSYINNNARLSLDFSSTRSSWFKPK